MTGRTARKQVEDALDDQTAKLLQWAIERWKAEVQNRPLVNVHRRSLDDAWRQVIRYAGGDPEALLGPNHDALTMLHSTASMHG